MITPNGKKINIVSSGSHFKVQFHKGGEIPTVLSGLFTSHGDAEQAVEQYLINKEILAINKAVKEEKEKVRLQKRANIK